MMSSTPLELIEADKAQRERRRTPALDGIAHWRLGRDADGLAWLVFDQQDSDVNTLSSATLGELDQVLALIEADPPAALVLCSAKAHGFCVGGDVQEFGAIHDTAVLTDMLQQGHRVVDRLARLAVPTVALIHGDCLGGGLELALACDHRIGLDGLKTGFPEVLIGLHPGLGGTVRALSTLAPVPAMTMMLTGKSIYGKRNRSIGVVADLVAPRHAAPAVRAAAAGEAAAEHKPWQHRALRAKPLRRAAAAWLRRQTRAKASPEHYPAPYALIDLWEAHGGNPAAMQQAEIESFARLVQTDTAQSLIRVFGLRQRLKRGAAGESGIRHVHVVGAGEMGADIAGWCAMQGLTTTLSDMQTGPLGKAVRRTEALCARAHQGRIDTRATLDRLIPDPDGLGLARADLVIEAVPESVDIKARVYAQAGERMRANALLVTNTSSIPLETLRTHAPDPARFAGLHFFNPVAKMQVVEVVHHDATAETTRARLNAFCGDIGKLPVPVQSYPGFLVNRALMPYLLEALVLLDEGMAAESIDQAALDFGMPMGPLELADHVGLDICRDVGAMLIDAVDKPMPALPDWFRRKVEAGDLGKKTGQGFYRWQGGKPQKSAPPAAPGPDTADRLLLPLLDACVECLRAGVVANADIVDGALVFATGFAPFRGGPLHHAQRRGVDAVVARLHALAEHYGERFRPDPGWSALGAREPGAR
jgi:3-hydroxyacyl-CoA dehydrogenase / enoyl-CoA hydratase / 3-hydroxybutyryl-CoA epimerase